MMNESGIRPLEYKIVVRPKEIEEKTDGGIIIPDSVKDKEKLHMREGTMVDEGWLAFEGWGDKP
jgi:co-chaperonin GroES (HSP10)